MHKIFAFFVTAVLTVLFSVSVFAAEIKIESAKYTDDGAVKVACSLTDGGSEQELTVIAYEADTDLTNTEAIKAESYKDIIHIDQITAEVKDGMLEFVFDPAAWIDRGKTYIVSVGGAGLNIDKMIISVDPDGTMTFIIGDTDGDDKVTAADAAYVLQKTLIESMELPIQSRSADWFKYADVDGDGKLTAADAALILQKTLLESFSFSVQ